MTTSVVGTDTRFARLRLPMQVRAVSVHVATFAGFLMLSAFWLRPLTWQMTDRVTGPGDPLTTAWRLVWPAQWLTQRGTPFWDTNIMYPAAHVFARDELTLGQSLFAGPTYLLSHNALLAYNVTVLLTFALSGFTTYCLAWHFLHHRSASIIAGIIVTFAPYHLAQIDHAGLLAVMWLPLVILFLHRTLQCQRWRDGAFVGIFAFLQALSAGYYAYWTALVILLFLGYVLVYQRHRLSRMSLARIAIPLCIALLALVPIVVSFQQVAAAAAFARPPREVEYWSARPQTWLAATPSNLLYGSFVRRYAWTWSTEMYLFPGLVALILSGIAMLVHTRKRIRWFALSLIICGVVLTLGPTLHLTRRDQGRFLLPYAVVYRLIPGGDALRAPIRAAPVAMIGIALLAAIGWVHVRAALRRQHCRPLRIVTITVLVMGFLLGEYAIAPLPTVAVPQLRVSDGSLVQWLRAQPSSIIAVFPDVRAPVSMALATTNSHRFINGDAEILPQGTQALFDRLADFPSVDGVAMLAALEVTYVIFDHHSYSEGDWQILIDRLASFAPSLTLAATLPDAAIYRVEQRGNRFSALRDVIPLDASVFIAPTAVDNATYLDRVLVAHALRQRRVRGKLRSGWTSDPDPPRPDEHFSVGITGIHEVLPDWCDPSAMIWTDGQLIAYRARSD